MNENINLLFEKLAKDKSLQEKFKTVTNADEAYELAASIQDGFSKEEFIATMKDIKAKMSKDISDEDLQKAAGGSFVTVNPIQSPCCITFPISPDAATVAI